MWQNLVPVILELTAVVYVGLCGFEVSLSKSVI